MSTGHWVAMWALLAIWALSLWLASHAGLVLVVGPNGEKVCMDMLSGYFGVDHTVDSLRVLGTVSVCLVALIPLAGLAWALARARRHWHRRASAS